MKLTWDDDDPERNQLTRRVLTRKEIEENDFRAYLASDTDTESETDAPEQGTAKGKGKADRDRLRALLLGGGNDTLPEGWNKGGMSGDEDDVDMEITFTPGLSESKPDGDETTIEKYARKMKEKKKKRKEEVKEKADGASEKNGKEKSLDDDFFGNDSDEGESSAEEREKPQKGKKGTKSAKKARSPSPAAAESKRVKSTAEELALVAIADDPSAEPRHFDMKAVLKAEKTQGRKRKGKKTGRKGEDGDEGEAEVQEDFAIDVKDERFQALHEDHTFAIDPSNPQ